MGATEKPQERGIIRTEEAFSRMLGMNISLVAMQRRDGVKSLSVVVDTVAAASVLLDGKSVNWTIFAEQENTTVAGASTIFNGSVQDVTR